MRNDAPVTAGIGDRIAPFTLPPYRSGPPRTWKPGRTTVLSFCALWCDTWKEQSARLVNARRALAGLPVEFLTISVDGRWAERFAAPGDTSPVLLDTTGRLSNLLGIRAVPYTFVVDPGGIVRFARQGIARSEELVPLLRALATGDTPDDGSSDTGQPLYLTFDDFPTVVGESRLSPDETLLDVLRASDAGRGTPATFFCIGEHLETPAGRAVARRAVREGHALQIHSWNHDARNPQLARCVQALQTIAPDLRPTLYRPPGSSDLRPLSPGAPPPPHRPVVNPYDFARPGQAELQRRILFAVRPGAIIQLHAGVGETCDILPALLTSLRRRGLTFALLR